LRIFWYQIHPPQVRLALAVALALWPVAVALAVALAQVQEGQEEQEGQEGEEGQEEQEEQEEQEVESFYKRNRRFRCRNEAILSKKWAVGGHFGRHFVENERKNEAFSVIFGHFGVY
jgi:flagellar biosynthesis/type III secretory pathway M-ring protein FliF/YscJ